MLLSYLLLAISVSIDSLGIGITYGLRKTKISAVAKGVLFFISLGITTMAVYLGNAISAFLPSFITKLIGTLLLIGMGFWIIYQSIYRKEKWIPCISPSNKQKTYQLFLKSLGITIKIIRNPISSDLDGSKHIDAKEALYLGLALSIDSICVGIGSSILGLSSFVFPIMVAVFQLVFLSAGNAFGKKVIASSTIPESIWNAISGILLICIGVSRFFL